jgi:hypothetical protein
MKGKGLATALCIEAVVGSLVLMVALDVWAHTRVEALGGVNVWGYRGPVAKQKIPNEIRVEVVGGTRAFSWGAPASAVASQLRRVIMLTTDQRGVAFRPITVINLGRMGILPDAYPATMEHYSYLRPDYICLYDDLGVRGATFADGTSAVFALTGYAPILPLVLREKGMAWRFGDVSRGYTAVESQSGPSTPALRRAAGRTLEAIGDVLGAADRFAARTTRSRQPDAVASDQSVDSYADAMVTAIDAAHRHARGVVVAVSPAETEEQVLRLRALEARLNGGIGSAPWFRLVDLGLEARLRDEALRIDGWNYSSAAITLAAELIAPAILSLIATTH